MGVIRFQVFPPGRVGPDQAARACFSGRDRFHWQSRTQVTDDGLVVERNVSDSGYFSLPWVVEGHGELMISTAWIVERDRPYHLQLELARGKLNQVRNQLNDWMAIGLAVPQDLHELIAQAMMRFVQAATKATDEPELAAQFAESSLADAMTAAQRLGMLYTEQAVAARMRHTSRLETRLGVNLGHSPFAVNVTDRIIKRAFNLAQVPLVWRQIEPSEGSEDFSESDATIAWCREEGVPVYAGPLLSFDDLLLPDWLCLWEGDYENVLECVTKFVEQTVERYRGMVHWWQCAARLNVGTALGLSQEEKLRLAVQVIQTTRRIDPETPITLSFDQPWAEYMNREAADPPIYLADTLVRAGLGVAAIGLEINLGYYPGGSSARDLLDVSQMVDMWSWVGAPLHIFLSFPSAAGEDPMASSEATPLPAAVPDGWSPAAQQALIERYVPLLVAKPMVQAVVWNQYRDAEPHHFPHSGLLDAQDRVKPAVQSLANVRKRFLK